MSNVLAKGMDTSKHQASKVDYAKANKSGYSFVILRVGYKNTKDSCFEKDYASAVAAGMKVGVYFYTMSTTEAQAIQDATRVLGWLNGRKLDLPVFYDLEDSTQKGVDRKNANANMYKAFRNKILKDGHYACGLYSGEYFFNNYINNYGLTENLWIAKYSTKEPSIGRQVAIWQYTSDSISGDFYNGKLDRNYMFVNVSTNSGEVIKGNPYPVPTRNLKRTIPMMRGNDVKWLQYKLGIEADGIFGNQTLKAVKNFQLAHGLKVDGIVGSATRYALQNL